MARAIAAAASAVAAAFVAAGTVVAAPVGAEGAAPLAVCFAASDPPRSARRGSRGDAAGFDLDVARLLAAQLRRPLRLVWLPEIPQTDIESTDLDFRPLLRGECDVQLSVPGAEAIAQLRNRFALSEPYYGAAYELLPQDSPWRWGAPYAGTVAVAANSVAHVAVHAAGLRWTMQETSADVLRALDDGAASAGLIWGPDLALLGERTKRSDNFEPPQALRWNLHAVTRRDDALLAELNEAFTNADVQHRILNLLARHGIPARSPFQAVHTRAVLAALTTAVDESDPP